MNYEATEMSVCRACQQTFPVESGWTDTHCSEECHELRLLPPNSGILVNTDGFGEDPDDYETDLCPGDYHCVYPVPGADINALPDEWVGDARNILFNWRQEGPPFQGCCCGHRHRALPKSLVRDLRRSGFVVTVVCEEDRGCASLQQDDGSCYDDDMGYDDDSFMEYLFDSLVLSEPTVGYIPSVMPYGTSPHDPEEAESLKERYLAGEQMETEVISWFPEPDEDPEEEEGALEDMGYLRPADEPEFIFLDDPAALPIRPNFPDWERQSDLPEVVGVFQIHHQPWDCRPYVVSHRFGGKVWNTLTWNDLVDQESFYLREEAVRYANTLMRHLNPSWTDAA